MQVVDSPTCFHGGCRTHHGGYSSSNLRMPTEPYALAMWEVENIISPPSPSIDRCFASQTETPVSVYHFKLSPRKIGMVGWLCLRASLCFSTCTYSRYSLCSVNFSSAVGSATEAREHGTFMRAWCSRLRLTLHVLWTTMRIVSSGRQMQTQ